MRDYSRSFGPVVIHGEDGVLRANCTRCTFRIGLTCTHIRPPQQIPNVKSTPEWCEMLESMLRDAAAAVAAEREK